MPLSKDEERQLVYRMRTGDLQAREQLVIEHLGLVKSIARKLCNPESNPELFNNLVQEGNVALIEAVDRFDPNKSVRLGTYAYPGIKGAMLDYLDEEQRKGINIPRPLRDLARKVGRVHDRLMQELERQPTVEEIAQVVGEPNERVKDALDLLACWPIESLDELMEPTEEGREAWEPSSQEPSPDEEVIIRVGIDAALRELRDDWREIVIRHVI